MYRDWGRIGNNSEDMNERFAYSIDGLQYDFKFLYEVVGYNFKSSEVNAAFGLVKLDRLPGFIHLRRSLFARYLENLKDVPDLILPNDAHKCNWLAMPLQTHRRLELVRYLESQGVQTRVIFSGNITRHPAYRSFLRPFANADAIMNNGFLVGCHHGMTTDDVDYVCSKIREFFCVPADRKR